MLSFRYLRIVRCAIHRIKLFLNVAVSGSDHGEDGPVHEAALRGSLEDVRKLILDKPHVMNAKGADARTPLTYAVWSGNMAMVTYLVNRGASVYERDDAGALPIHHAGFHGFPELVEYFVEKGNDVNARDSDRCTPLFYASYAGHVDTLLMLMYLGGDPNMVNNQGKSPQDVACMGGNRQNRDAILAGLEAAMKLRRDPEERARLKGELKARRAVEAKDSKLAREREDASRRDAIARKRREAEERKRIEQEEQEADVQWQLAEEQAKKNREILRNNGPRNVDSAQERPKTSSGVRSAYEDDIVSRHQVDSRIPAGDREVQFRPIDQHERLINSAPPPRGHPYYPPEQTGASDSYGPPPRGYHYSNPHGPDLYGPYPPQHAYGPPPGYGPPLYGPPSPPYGAYPTPGPVPRWYTSPYPEPDYQRYTPSPPHGETYHPNYCRPPSWDYYRPASPVYYPPPREYSPPVESRRPQTAPAHGRRRQEQYDDREEEYEKDRHERHRHHMREDYDEDDRGHDRENGRRERRPDRERDRELEEMYAKYEEEKRKRERLEREQQRSARSRGPRDDVDDEDAEDSDPSARHMARHRREPEQDVESKAAPEPARKADAVREAPGQQVKEAPSAPREPGAGKSRKRNPPLPEEDEHAMKSGAIRNGPIHEACLSGNMSELKRLMADKPSLVHKRGLYMRTPLLCSSSRGHLDISRLLVEEGASIEAMDEIKWSALHHAAANGHAPVIRFLVDEGHGGEMKTNTIPQQGSEVNCKDKYDWTPLYRAAYNGHVEAVEALLELGANASLRDEKGKTAAQMACTGGNKHNKEVIIRMLEHGPSRTLRKTESSENAKLRDNKEPEKAKDVSRALLREGSSKALNGPAKNGPIHSACFRGNLSEVKRLVEENRLLLEAKGDYSRTPLMYAAGGGHLEVCKYLIDQKAALEAVDDYLSRPLHMAALNGQAAIIDYLTGLGADVNARAKHNCTPLYYAAYNGHTLAVRNLLIKGADKTIADEKGRTALQVACDAPNTTSNKTSVVSLFNIPSDKLRA